MDREERTGSTFIVFVGVVVLGKAAVNVSEGEGRRTTGIEALRESVLFLWMMMMRDHTCQTSATKRSQKRIRRR